MFERKWYNMFFFSCLNILLYTSSQLIFRTRNGYFVERQCDLLHFTPSVYPILYLRNTPLLDESGLVNVNPFTLQNPQYDAHNHHHHHLFLLSHIKVTGNFVLWPITKGVVKRTKFPAISLNKQHTHTHTHTHTCSLTFSFLTWKRKKNEKSGLETHFSNEFDFADFRMCLRVETVLIYPQWDHLVLSLNKFPLFFTTYW
jgi:hypothetical protein